MVANVVAVEDCTAKVRPMPEKIALIGEPVNLDSHKRNDSPAISFRLSVIKVIPIRNKPIPPHNCAITSNMQLPNKYFYFQPSKYIRDYAMKAALYPKSCIVTST